jgi:hypothetical protein
MTDCMCDVKGKCRFIHKSHVCSVFRDFMKFKLGNSAVWSSDENTANILASFFSKSVQADEQQVWRILSFPPSERD